jgi:hypothetical protein
VKYSIAASDVGGVGPEREFKRKMSVIGMVPGNASSNDARAETVAWRGTFVRQKRADINQQTIILKCVTL